MSQEENSNRKSICSECNREFTPSEFEPDWTYRCDECLSNDEMREVTEDWYPRTL